MKKTHLGGTVFYSIDKIEDISFDNGIIPDYITSINYPLSVSDEFSVECDIDAQLFSNIMGVDLISTGDLRHFTVEGVLPYQVQIRRHKKKRINKKWAKRYGYKTVFKQIKLTDVQVIEHETDVDITGRLFK